LLAAGSFLQAGSGVYNALLGKLDSNDRELVYAALELNALLPRFADDGKNLAFWYPPDAESHSLRMLQAIQLPFSLLGQPEGRSVDLIDPSEQDAALLRKPQLAHLILLAESGEPIDKAVASLRRLSLSHRVAQRRHLGSKRFPVEFAHVILDHPTNPPFMTYPATAFQAGPAAIMRYDADGATLTTGTKALAWDATLDFANTLKPGRPATVTVALQARRGRTSLALIRRGQPDKVIQEAIIAQSRSPLQVSLQAKDGADVSLIAVRNQMNDGTRGEVRIFSVTVAGDEPGSRPLAPRPLSQGSTGNALSTPDTSGR
jgi:hypothetical protein